MSQVGVANLGAIPPPPGSMTNLGVDASTAPGTNPVLPNGGGTITVTGAQVAAGTVGANVIRTDSLAASTMTIEIQRSTAVGASASANNGVAHFNSAEFTVDANGFVSLAGGGLAVDSFAMQTGTSPVVPTGAGLVTFNGALVAAGTNPVRTDGTGANTMTLEVQTSQALAAADSTKVGLCNFDSASFAVAATGFVTLSGTGVGKTITGDTGGALSPTAGNWNILGNSPVAGTNPVQTTGAGSTLTVNVQKSQALAATDATKVGLSNFDSAKFTVDANGFVSTVGTAFATKIAVDAATAPGTNPVLPTAAGQITMTGAQVAAGTVGANVIRTDSLAANTLTVEIQRSTAVASTASANNGVSHFNSANFTVDANGFVTSLGTGFVWIDQGTSITLAKNTGYFVTAATTQTLPAAPAQGDTVKIICDTTGAVVVTANAGQTIRQGTAVSSAAGTFTSTSRGDALELFYRAATTQWIALNGNGTWVPA